VPVLADLVGLVAGLAPGGRALVGIDGPDAAGKTTLADRLAAALPGPVVRASGDGFHRPREVRMRRGSTSAVGYYEDAFDVPRLERELLAPFASGATTVSTAVHDYGTDTPSVQQVHDVPAAAVLVVDGMFLLRPQLRHWWTVAVLLVVPEEVVLARARVRDLPLYGTPEAVEQRYRARYLPAQELYRADADPRSHADVVLDNSHPDDPVVLRWDRVPGSRR
jgi:uridine kinase